MNEEIDGWKTYKGDICLKSAKKQGNGVIENYQNYEIATAMSACAKWRVAVDVGAHVGITAYQMAKSFEHVHAFEINPKVFPYLKENLAYKKISNVTLYPVGLGEKEMTVDINTSNKSFSTHVKPSSEGEGVATIKPLDFFNLRDVDFIKIDAEGFEPFVALGGIKTIERCKPVIMFECKDHPARYGYHKDSIREILSPYGYRMIRRLGRNEKNAVIGYRPGMAPDV
jgi:FkbM family methyltransferase